MRPLAVGTIAGFGAMWLVTFLDLPTWLAIPVFFLAAIVAMCFIPEDDQS